MNEDIQPQSGDQPPQADVAQVRALLARGDMRLVGLMPDSSNYTFLAEVDDGELQSLAIYKPRQGERPLWDFPRGTLSYREVSAYLLSEALGWNVVPPTVLRDGPEYGTGSVQFFVNHDPAEHYFTLRGTCDPVFQRIAAFDVLVNNADRKGGHILRGIDGHIWGIDHGITFHDEPKLRTVIWEYAGQPLPADLVPDIERVNQQLDDVADPLTEQLTTLLQRDELAALRRRIERLLRRPIYPGRNGYHDTPWPPI